MNGVILYGPPAAGKDTVTAELVALDPRFTHFERLKCGPGRTAGYRMVEPEQLAALPSEVVLWTNRRYDAVYLVDRPGLAAIWQTGRIPVVHLGQPEAVTAVTAGTPAARWLVVELHAPLPVLRARIEARGTGDDAARVTAAIETPRLDGADLVVDTGTVSAAEAARLVAERSLQQQRGPGLAVR